MCSRRSKKGRGGMSLSVQSLWMPEEWACLRTRDPETSFSQFLPRKADSTLSKSGLLAHSVMHQIIILPRHKVAAGFEYFLLSCPSPAFTTFASWVWTFTVWDFHSPYPSYPRLRNRIPAWRQKKCATASRSKRVTTRPLFLASSTPMLTYFQMKMQYLCSPRWTHHQMCLLSSKNCVDKGCRAFHRRVNAL